MAEIFGTLQTGETVHRHQIAAGDLSVAVLTRGAILHDVRLSGLDYSLTLGSPVLADYEGGMASCGCIVGPVANRIAGCEAEIDGQLYRFTSDRDDPHLLHGGDAAIHSEVWEVVEATAEAITLTIDMPDGEGGFPGNRRITARYAITAPATLRLTLQAKTDAPTLMNLANHSYWRLDPGPTFAAHTLRVAADRYLPSSEDLIPLGAPQPVAGTRFDFREGRVLQPGVEGLIDNNFCVSDARVPLRPVAWLTAPSGVSMEMGSNEPGLQVFDAHIMDLPEAHTHDGPAPIAHAAVALEAQHWPNAPHNPDYPSIVLRPGEAWEQITEWRFSKP